MSESDNSRTAHFTMVGGDDDGGEQADNQDQPPPPNNADEEAMYLEMRRLTEEKAQSSHDLVKDLELCLLDSTPDEAVVYLDQIIASTRPEDEQVKCALVDFLPDLASQLYNCSNDWSRRLKPLVNSHFIRIVEFALQYQNVQVAKTGHVALVRLLGHGFVHHELLETRIWPILMENIAHLEDTDNLVVDTIHLMNKLMECFNDDQTERVVVPSLTQLSTSLNVAVRRVLAQLYGDFCAVASISCAEKLVLPFLRLCSDADYVTRKTCAEVFMSVSSTVSLETRKASLAPVFEKLLVDPVRWVTLAAYQSLGPFIATFAEPSITSLGYNHLGELVLKHPDGFESKGKSRPGEGDDLEDNDNRYQGSMSVGRITTDWLTFQDRNAELLQLVPDGRSHSDPRSVRKSTMRDFAKWKRQNELAFPMGNQSNNEEEEEDGMEGEAIVVLGESEDVVEEEIEDENDEAKEETPQSNEDHDEDLVIDHVEEIVCTNWSGVTGKEPKDENFNTFQFWREPLPDIDTELHSAAMDSKFQSKDQSSSPNQKSQSALSNDAFLNNNPVEIVSLRPRRILRPPTGQHRTPEKQAEEYLFRDPGAEDTPNPLGEPQRKTKLMQGLFTSSNCSPLLPSALADRDSSLNSSISSVGSNQDHPYAQYMNVTPASKRSSVSDQEADDQDIVPKDLVSQFVSMAWHASSHEVENDLAHHCAYNLPAVVLTLGPKHWGLLKSAYKTLAEAFDWKVRQTAASSIHELAVIVGEEAATQDLVPVFHGFIKDLDEVRVAALKHLAHFLKLLRPAGRETFLPLFTEFLMMDNEWRWRFRYELAEQLLQVIGFFSPADTCHHLTPIVMMLLMDRVSDVRKIALQLVTELVSHVSIDIPLLRSLLTQLAEQFAHSNRWNRRQTFALFCSRLVSESVLSGDMFSRDVLPHLLDLSWDPVPNVRLTVARALANDIMAQSFFTDITSPHYEVLVGVLKRLQADKDKDVRYFSSQVPQNLQLRINESNFKILSSSICEEETKNL